MYNPFTSGRERVVEMDPAKLVESIAHDLHGAEPTDALRARYAAIVAKFRASFGETAEIDFIVRAPGRINLIGEHIDYCGGSVLPMAVSQDVIIAGARNRITPQLHIVNVDAKFDEKKIPLSGGEQVTIDRAAHHWTNYFLCGYKGVMEGISDSKDPIGLNLVVSGTVPAGGGMSSSSALVCAAALATLTAYQRPIDNKAVAEVAQRSERYVGTESGGMDQGACEQSSSFACSFQCVSVSHRFWIGCIDNISQCSNTNSNLHDGREGLCDAH